MERGIPAITIEVGDPQRFQSRFIKATRNGIWSMLADFFFAFRVNPLFCTIH